MSFTPSRRTFLAASLATLVAGPTCSAEKDAKKKDDNAVPEGPTTKILKPEDIVGKSGKGPADPETLFLTWLRDPTTTMTIQWVGTADDSADNARVTYAPAPIPRSLAQIVTQPATLPSDTAPAGPWLTRAPLVRPYPVDGLRVYRCELTGLKPDTAYMFKIGKSQRSYRFRTMPAKATNPIAFISGGDAGVNAHAVANNIQAARQDPQFAVIGGDLAYEDGKNASTHLTFLRNYSRTMVGREGRLIPMLACLGNHEVQGGYAKSRAKAPFFYSLFDGLFAETGFATLDFGDYLSLVLLDTGHTSLIEGEQTSWLEKTLKARVDHPNVFVVNHVPAYPSFRKMGETPATQPGVSPKAGTGAGNREHWCPLFDRYRVPVVLEHHDHTFKRTKPLIDGMVNPDGVQYLGDGSWGKIRAPQAPEKLGFLETSSRDYHLSLHRIQGDERFHLALDEFGRVMDVGHSGQRKTGLVQVKGDASKGG